MRYITFIFLCLLVVAALSSCQRSYFKAVSEKIDNIYRGDRKVSGSTFHSARLLAYKEYKEVLDRIFSNDTVFLLEQYDFEVSQILSTFWSQNETISFSQSRDKIAVVESPFDASTKGLIQRWDTTGIRKQEKLHSDVLPALYNYGSRILKRDKSFQVDTIAFRRFVNIN